MSQSQINATDLLCRVLEQPPAQVSGDTLITGEYAEAGLALRRERLLVHCPPLDWVSCPECHVESARVTGDLPNDSVRLLCPSCGEVSAHRTAREMFKTPLSKFVATLANGLGLSTLGIRPIEPDLSWRLGTTEPARTKPCNWYFGRRLHRNDVALRLREQIARDKALGSCVVLTSSEVPLPAGSVLTDLEMHNLAQVGRIGQSKFEFYGPRLPAPGPQAMAQAQPGTTLRYVRSECVAWVDDVRYDLEPLQQQILIALIEDRDHEMDKLSLREACSTQSKNFKPSKIFERNPVVYKTYIRYQWSDETYALTVPPEDRDWLN